MKKSEFKRKYKACLSSMPSRVKVITGRYLPDIPCCTNYIELSGRTIALTSMPVNVHRLQFDQYWVARDALYQLLYGDISTEEYQFVQTHQQIPDEQYKATYKEFRETLYAKYYERTIQAYIALLKEEAKLGCVRVPTTHTQLPCDKEDENTVLTKVPTPATDVIEHTAKIFATAWLKGTPCSAISVQLKDPVDTQDYLKVQMIIKQCCEVYNQYITAKIHQKRLTQYKRSD